MGFVSYGFPLLVGGLLLVYYLLPRERRWWALLVGSWGFYALCGLRYVPFLAFVTGSVYLGARGIRALEEKLREREAELAEERRLNRRLTAKLLLEGNAEEGSGQNTGNEAASGQ